MECVHELMHQYRARLLRTLREQPGGIAHMDGKVLGFVVRHPGATQGELVAHSGRDKGQIARLVAGLVERGLLEGRPDAADRRVTRLRITPAGASALRTLQQQRRRLGSVAVRGLDDGERAALLAMLQRMRANLDAPD